MIAKGTPGDSFCFEILTYLALLRSNPISSGTQRLRCGLHLKQTTCFSRSRSLSLKMTASAESSLHTGRCFRGCRPNYDKIFQ